MAVGYGHIATPSEYTLTERDRPAEHFDPNKTLPANMSPQVRAEFDAWIAMRSAVTGVKPIVAPQPTPEPVSPLKAMALKLGLISPVFLPLAIDSMRSK
jgi:hypothetical protein